jgi:hypothetical protein
VLTEIEVANVNLGEHANKLAETMATRREKMVEVQNSLQVRRGTFSEITY